MPQAGMVLIETLRFTMSAMPSARAWAAYKYDPVLYFNQNDYGVVADYSSSATTRSCASLRAASRISCG
jgi:hypothetical protein